MKLLKLIAKGRKAVVPTSIADEESNSNSSSRGVRNSMAYASGTSTSVIPNRQVTVNNGDYTPPPKRRPWVYIPEGVCKNC